MLGTRQTGIMQMRVADLMRDRDLLPEVRRVADRLLSAHSDSIPRILDRPAKCWRNTPSFEPISQTKSSAART